MKKKNPKFIYCHFCEACARKEGEFIPKSWDVFKRDGVEFIACWECLPTVRHSLESFEQD